MSHLSAGQEALAAISAELGLDDSPSGEAAQLLLSIISLCWFPMIHARTVAPAVGVRLEDGDELEQRKRHVINLVLHGLRGLTAHDRPPPQPQPSPRAMTDLLTPPVKPPHTPLATEQEAREVAEAAREKEWESPSFVRELFEGKFRLDLVHPFPQPDPADLERARPFMERLERFMRERVDSDKIDRDGKIPTEIVKGLGDIGAFGIKIPHRVRRPRPEPVQLHPRGRPGDQPGRQPHCPALRGAVDRRAALRSSCSARRRRRRSISPVWRRARSRPLRSPRTTSAPTRRR